MHQTAGTPVSQGSNRRLRLLLALGSAAIGCVGNVGGGTNGSGNAGSPPGQNGNTPGTSVGGGMSTPGGAGTQAPAPGSVSAGVAPLRRLTSEQYRNTVRDLLGVPDAMLPALSLPADDAVADRFFSNVSSSVEGVDLDRYADAAATLGKLAMTNMATLVPCDPKAMGEAACAGKFIESFGRRAYRRPLNPVEIGRLQKVYAAGGDFPGGIELVVEALLQSPKFLYLIEPVPANAAGQVVAVDSWAMASRLSYFLLDTMPDDALLDAATGGHLGKPEDIAAQAMRLTSDPRFRVAAGAFHQQWLEVNELAGAEKDPMLFPATVWNPAIKTALGEETRRFVEYVMSDGDGRLDTLLSAPFSILGGPLYDYYGVTKPAGAAVDAWQKTDLPVGQRAGILTQGSIMASQAHEDRTSFILRGKLIREAIFCVQIPPPPPNAANGDTTLPATASAKERAAAHRDRPECKSCHELFDPIGFAFENYDAAGRYRTTEGGKPIDATVALTNTQKLDGPITNAVDLAKKIAGAEEVQNCVAQQWTRFALGRLETTDDASSVDAARKALRDTGKIRDLVVALAQSDSFRFQRVSP